MPDHYFSARPASADERRTISVRLAGADRRLVTAAGVFSPGRVDQGTAVLLAHAPEPPRSGVFLDIGCGWGPLALSLALASPEASVWGVDVNARALDLLRANARSLGLDNVHAATPDEVPVSQRFDLIWSNPPIRVGKKALHELMRTWLPRLAGGGTAYLVVQKNLGSDSLHRWLNEEFGDDGLATDRIASAKGYRVLRVRRG